LFIIRRASTPPPRHGLLCLVLDDSSIDEVEIEINRYLDASDVDALWIC
jgi:hypothetical protein